MAYTYEGWTLHTRSVNLKGGRKNRLSISSADAYQKARHPAIYQTDTLLVLIREPVFLTLKRN